MPALYAESQDHGLPDHGCGVSESELSVSEIQPALTAEGWSEALAYGNPRQIDSVFELADPDTCHYIAALALHGQPFGFTWEDVDLLRDYAVMDDHADIRFGYGDILGLADRIAALLPPRERPRDLTDLPR